MKKQLLILGLVILGLSSCEKEQYSVEKFKSGVFEIPATDRYSKTEIIRNDSLQIEYYEDRVDSLKIVWLSNFKYDLIPVQIENAPEEEIIHVRIKKIRANEYDFEAKIGISNFTSKATLIKIK